MSICYIKLNGEMISQKEYCRRKGYNYNTITDMMYKKHLTFEDAVNQYIVNKNRRKCKDKRLRNIWYHMVDRCYNSKCKAYLLYGGRGITVQDSWKDNYFNFEDDLYVGYIKHVEEFGEKDTTLDRIDYNGNYELNNIRWATQEEQANNTSRNFIIVDNLTIAQFAKKYNLPIFTVWYRIHHGWSIEKIINIPTGVRCIKHKLPCNISLRSHCEQNGYKYQTIYRYIYNHNLTAEQALAKYLKNRQKKPS